MLGHFSLCPPWYFRTDNAALMVGRHVEVMAFLLEAGADVSMEKMDLGVPLHDAAFGGHKAAADLLLKFGQDDVRIKSFFFLLQSLKEMRAFFCL